MNKFKMIELNLRIIFSTIILPVTACFSITRMFMYINAENKLPSKEYIFNDVFPLLRSEIEDAHNMCE